MVQKTGHVSWSILGKTLEFDVDDSGHFEVAASGSSMVGDIYGNGTVKGRFVYGDFPPGDITGYKIKCP